MSLRSLVNDPDFQKLSPTDQRQAVLSIEPDAGKLNDTDYSTLLNAMHQPGEAAPRESVMNSIANGIGDMISNAPEMATAGVKAAASYPLGLPANASNIVDAVSSGSPTKAFYELMPQLEQGADVVSGALNKSLDNTPTFPRADVGKEVLKAVGMSVFPPRPSAMAMSGMDALEPSIFPQIVGRKTAEIAGAPLGFLNHTEPKSYGYAFENSPTFKRAISGPEESGKIPMFRNKEYAAGKEEVRQIKEPLDLSPVKDQISATLKDFKVAERPEPFVQGRNINTSGLDFSDSEVQTNPQLRTVITKVKDIFEKYDEGSKTPGEVHTLYKNIDNMMTEDPKVQAFLTPIIKSLTTLMKEKVPGYAEMSKNYVESLGAEKAGDDLSKFFPKGLVGRSLALSTLYHPGAHSLMFPFLSPKIMGKAFQAAGEVSRFPVRRITSPTLPFLKKPDENK